MAEIQLDSMQPHIVVMPYPLQGHLNPMLQLAKLLADDVDLLVTVVHTRHNYDRIAAKGHAGSCSVRHVWIQDGLPSNFNYSDVQHRLTDFHLGICDMREPFRDFLLSLGQSRPATCVVYGSFCPWPHDVASELGIPTAFFWTQSASVLNIYYHHSLLSSNGFFPYSQFTSVAGFSSDTSSLSKSYLVNYIPGALPLYPCDIPSFLHVDESSDPMFGYIRQQLECADASRYVIINSFYELDREACDALLLDIQCKSVFFVGPLLPSAFLGNEEAEQEDDSASVGANLLDEKNDCIKWLDKQARQSVLYICFGTIFQPPAEQLKAYAVGIQASKQPFLWVINLGSSSSGLSEILPDNFEEDIRGQGLIIPWAPQLQVLSHPSIGAFLSHCGWNSTLESIAMGMPMLLIPSFSDQKTNARYAVDVWKAGMLVERVDGMVSSEEVQRVVKAAFCSPQGRELQARAREWKDTARRATRRGGSSHKDLQCLIQSIKYKKGHGNA